MLHNLGTLSCQNVARLHSRTQFNLAAAMLQLERSTTDPKICADVPSFWPWPPVTLSLICNTAQLTFETHLPGLSKAQTVLTSEQAIVDSALQCHMDACMQQRTLSMIPILTYSSPGDRELLHASVSCLCGTVCASTTWNVAKRNRSKNWSQLHADSVGAGNPDAESHKSVLFYTSAILLSPLCVADTLRDITRTLSIALY